MKIRFYFESEHEEICHELEYFTLGMKEGESIHLHEAVPEKSHGIGWCKEFGEVIYNGDEVCGKVCKSYDPRNGKSGCCKAYTSTLYGHGDLVEVSIENGKVVIKNLKTKNDNH